MDNSKPIRLRAFHLYESIFWRTNREAYFTIADKRKGMDKMEAILLGDRIYLYDRGLRPDQVSNNPKQSPFQIIFTTNVRVAVPEIIKDIPVSESTLKEKTQVLPNGVATKPIDDGNKTGK